MHRQPSDESFVNGSGRKRPGITQALQGCHSYKTRKEGKGWGSAGVIAEDEGRGVTHDVDEGQRACRVGALSIGSHLLQRGLRLQDLLSRQAVPAMAMPPL